MIAIILHNIPEGVITFITNKENLNLGINLTVAILLHNITEGISIAIPIYAATGNKNRAVIYTSISALAEPLGAILAFLFLSPIVTNNILGLLPNFLAWFIDEQVEEEENARDLVRQATMIGDHIGGMIMLDKELGAREYHTPSPLK